MMAVAPHQNLVYPEGYKDEDIFDQEYIKSDLLSEWWRKKKSIPSIHMPRWASRILLEITDIRGERVQDISKTDAIAEGLAKNKWGNWASYLPLKEDEQDFEGWLDPTNSFMELWDSINDKRGYGWAKNDWVWAIEFKVICK